MKPYLRPLLIVFLALLFTAGESWAQRRGGGRAHMARGGARTSISARPAHAARPNVDRSNVARNVANRPDAPDRSRTVERHVERDINRDRDIDVDFHGADYDYDHDGCCHHPIAAAAVTTAAVATTAAAIDSMVDTLPPGCTTVVVDGITYEQCESTWYQPQFSGTETTYIIVTDPN